jgi:carbon starvation protein CstA
LGKIGGILAVFGVVAAPITSGDTAFRSARLTIADSINFSQNTIGKRLLITIPIFGIAVLLTEVDFAIIWRYFGWSNQMLAAVVLWAIAVYLKKQHKAFWFVLLPSAFMTAVVVTYILVAPEGLGLDYMLSCGIGLFAAIALSVWFVLFKVEKESN